MLFNCSQFLQDDKPHVVMHAIALDDDPVVETWPKDHNSDKHWKLFQTKTSSTTRGQGCCVVLLLCAYCAHFYAHRV